MRYGVFSTRELFGVLVSEIGFSGDPSVTHFGPVRRNQAIIHYCLRGTGFFNGHRVSAGEGFLIHPGDAEEYHADPAHPWTLLWVVLSGPASDAVTAYYSADPDSGIFPFSYGAALDAVCETIRQRTGRVTPGMEAAELFLSVLNLHFLAAESRPAGAAREYAAFARTYLDSHYFQKITVAEIAEKLGLSEPYLCRVFKAAYGLSPRQYLSQQRLQSARLALESGSLPVGEIGRSVGFDDPLAFSAFFRRCTGLSPEGYRAAQRR